MGNVKLEISPEEMDSLLAMVNDRIVRTQSLVASLDTWEKRGLGTESALQDLYKLEKNLLTASRTGE